MAAMKRAISFRFTVGALLRLIALIAANCAILRYYTWHWQDDERAIFLASLIGLLPLMNASVFGISAIVRGYRIKVRRCQAGDVAPFWVRFGLVSGVVLCAAAIAVAIAPRSIEHYFSFAADEIDAFLNSQGMICGAVDYGPLLPRLVALWTLLSGPPLVAVAVISALSGRYRLTIDRTTSA